MDTDFPKGWNFFIIIPYNCAAVYLFSSKKGAKRDFDSKDCKKRKKIVKYKMKCLQIAKSMIYCYNRFVMPTINLMEKLEKGNGRNGSADAGSGNQKSVE